MCQIWLKLLVRVNMQIKVLMGQKEWGEYPRTGAEAARTGATGCVILRLSPLLFLSMFRLNMNGLILNET